MDREERNAFIHQVAPVRTRPVEGTDNQVVTETCYVSCPEGNREVQCVLLVGKKNKGCSFNTSCVELVGNF